MGERSLFRRSVRYLFTAFVIGVVAAARASTDVDFFNPADFYNRTESTTSTSWSSSRVLRSSC